MVERIRPEVNFISNARPAMLKWRDLEIEKTPIIKSPEIKKYRSRTNKKYHNNVPLHYGYSRKLVKARESPLPNIFRKKSLRNRGSSTSWLPAPSFVNGLPKTIYHFKYPLKTRKLNTVNDHHYNAMDNVGSKESKYHDNIAKKEYDTNIMNDVENNDITHALIGRL